VSLEFVIPFLYFYVAAASYSIFDGTQTILALSGLTEVLEDDVKEGLRHESRR